MHHVKELHLVSNLEALNTLAVSEIKKTISNKKPVVLLHVARNIYPKCWSNPLDEEFTYVFLYRFLTLYNHLLTVHEDKNYVSALLKKEVHTAKIKIAELETKLNKRYEEAVEKVESQTKIPVSIPLHSIEQHASVFKNEFISCLELYNVLNNKNLHMLVMDCRSEKDFGESHIKEIKIINIPESCIRSGLSAHQLGLSLPTSSLEQWNRRDSFDVVILLDWNTCKTNYMSSKVHKLHTILVEWDIGKTYKEKPVILNNGYLEWLEMYPTLCTNASIKYTKANTELDDLLDLDSIEYPTDSEPKSHDVFAVEIDKDTVGRPDLQKSRDELLEEEKCIIEMNTQISKKILKTEQEWKDIHHKIVNAEDGAKLEELKKKEEKVEEAISKLVQEEEDLIEKQTKIVNQFNLAVSFKPGEEPLNTTTQLEDISKLQQRHLDIVQARQEYADDRQRLLNIARQAKKSEWKSDKNDDRPSINRLTKPKMTMSNHIEGKLESISNGLTGLYNIKNTCYMNTIIQCLRHVPQIIEFYCNGEYSKHIHRSLPVIMNEAAHLVRALWSNSYSVIKPIEFYKKFTSLSPVYKAGYHEDCMEFFLQLYNYLSEDCALEISSKNYWSETQMAWYKQHGGKVSFYINMFYHQVRILHTCLTCRTSNVKFEIENIFYLSVPDKPFKLEQSMQSYLTGREKLTCKKCKNVKEIKKSISFNPTILVVALKRHIQDYIENNTVHYRKNENQCYFPVDHFQVGHCTYALRAIALHVGNMQSGHYTAACLNPTNDRWYLFNDENVSQVDINEASLRTKAYAFFYSLKRNYLSSSSAKEMYDSERQS